MTARWRKTLAVAAGVAALWATPALADDSDPLEKANSAFEAGDFAAAELAARAALGVEEKGVRAEAWRLVGLSLFYQNRLLEAETSLLEYLKLDTDAQLDPAIHPPNAIVFFANVRSRHQAEIDKARPKREERRFLLTLVPPFGQFENNHTTKGLIIGGAELTLLAGSIATFAVLRSWCNETTKECPGREDDAKVLQGINIGFGLAFIGAYAYGVFDGVRHYRKWQRKQNSLRGSLSGFVVPMSDGVAAGLSATF